MQNNGQPHLPLTTAHRLISHWFSPSFFFLVHFVRWWQQVPSVSSRGRVWVMSICLLSRATDRLAARPPSESNRLYAKANTLELSGSVEQNSWLRPFADLCCTRCFLICLVFWDLLVPPWSIVTLYFPCFSFLPRVPPPLSCTFPELEHTSISSLVQVFPFFSPRETHTSTLLFSTWCTFCSPRKFFRYFHNWTCVCLLDSDGGFSFLCLVPLYFCTFHSIHYHLYLFGAPYELEHFRPHWI